MNWFGIKSQIAIHILLGLLCFQIDMGFAQDAKTVRKAYDAKVESDADFATMFDFVRSSDEEEKWRKIAWIPSLWSGIEFANEKQKPIFVWAMNGDPLGCV